MAYTRHGHQIPETKVEGPQPPRYRCGGVGLCKDCSREAKAVFGVEWCIDHNIAMADCIICSPKCNKLEVELKDEEGTIHLGPGVVRNGTVTFDIYELSERYNVTFRTIKKDN